MAEAADESMMPTLRQMQETQGDHPHRFDDQTKRRRRFGQRLHETHVSTITSFGLRSFHASRGTASTAERCSVDADHGSPPSRAGNVLRRLGAAEQVRRHADDDATAIREERS